MKALDAWNEMVRPGKSRGKAAGFPPADESPAAMPRGSNRKSSIGADGFEKKTFSPGGGACPVDAGPVFHFATGRWRFRGSEG
jgi:hypothetical protein